MRVPVLMKEEAEQAPIVVPVLVKEEAAGRASIFIPEVASAPDEAEETEGRELVVIADEGAAVVERERRERALAEATTVGEVNDLAARAEAARRYLKRSKSALKKQNEAAFFRLRCLRKLGALLSTAPKHPGSRRLHDDTARRLHDDTASPPTLAELGISKRDSAKWQRLAAIPEGLFNEHCRKIMEGGAALAEASFSALVGRLREASARWTLPAALRRLHAAITNARRRWPEGQEARDALTAELRAHAADVEKQEADGAAVAERAQKSALNAAPKSTEPAAEEGADEEEEEEEAPQKRRRAPKTVTMTVEEALTAMSETAGQLADEMEEWRDNTEEKFSATQKYDEVSTAEESLREMAENSAPSDLLARLPDEAKQLAITVPTLGARASRAARLGTACAAVTTACALLREKHKDAPGSPRWPTWRGWWTRPTPSSSPGCTDARGRALAIHREQSN